MNNFLFENKTKVYFGKGGVKEYLGCLLEHYGDTVMLAYGGGSIKHNGVYPDRQATDRPARKRTCCLHKLPSLRKCSIFLLLCCRESRDGNVPAFPFP